MFFLNKIQNFEFPCCRTREDLSIDVLINTARLILTKLGYFFFSGYGQIDRHDFGILTWIHVGTKKIQLKAENKELAVDPYMPPRMTGMHNDVHKQVANILHFCSPGLTSDREK